MAAVGGLFSGIYRFIETMIYSGSHRNKFIVRPGNKIIYHIYRPIIIFLRWIVYHKKGQIPISAINCQFTQKYLNIYTSSFNLINLIVKMIRREYYVDVCFVVTTLKNFRYVMIVTRNFA